MATADSIVKLKLESGEYEAKIKRASQGLLAMEQECRKAGRSMNEMNKEQKDFVQALGRMETKSQTTKGKIGELSSAFIELRSQYNRLTDDEKKGDFGKALNKSLGELRHRIQEGQSELRSIGGEINNNGNLLDQLSSKFGVNIKQLGGWGAALAAGKVALDVMKDAFFASEANLDDWNRAVYAGESVWDAFLTSINTGDISGYLGKIDSIISAAKEAYNELDRLSTQKAINNPAIKAQEAENERMRAMLRTGRYISPNDGRKGAMKEGQVLTDAQKQKIAQSLENGMQKLNGYVRSEIDQTTKAIGALYTQQAKQLGMSLQEFKAGTANMGAFDERMAGYNNYKAYEGRRSAIQARANSGHNISDAEAAILRGANPYQQYKAWGVFKDDGKLFDQINDLINQRASLQSQNYGNTANAYRAINRATGIGSGSGGGRGGTKKQVDLSFIFDPKSDFSQKETEKLLASIDAPLGLSAKLGLTADSTNAMALKNAIQGFDTDHSFISTKKRKEFTDMPIPFTQTDEWKSVGQGIGEMTGIVGNIENIASAIGVDLGKGFRGILTGLTVITTILETIESIETVGSILGIFHNGGIVHAAQGVFVPGIPNGGRDTVPAMLSPGELVLNHAQQANLARQLQSNNSGGGFVGQPYVQSETIYLGVNNHLKRTGQGEIVTTKMLQKYL